VARLEPVERVLRSPDPPATSPLPVRAPRDRALGGEIMYGYTQSQMSQVGIRICTKPATPEQAS
jgi:hypothetical protein